MSIYSLLTREFITDNITERKDHHVDIHDFKINRISHTTNRWRLDHQQIEVTPSGENQLLSAVGIPVKFFRKCPEHLKREIFSHFASQKVDKNYLLRLHRVDGNLHLPDEIRAVLSSQYGVHDDHQIFPVALEELDKYDVMFQSLEHDDYITRLEVRFNDLTVQHNGQTYYAGVAITNSETGHAAIWVEPIVIAPHWKVHNRRTLLAQGADIRTVHRGEFDAERVREQIQFARDVGQVGITQVLEAQENLINKAKALQFVKSCDTMPVRFAEILEEEWQEKQDVIRADAWQRILDLAKTLPLFQRTKVEQDVGRWTGVFQNYQQRIDDILLELSID